MKTIELTEFGGPEVLKIVDLPEPQPERGEVRINVHTAAVNPADITFRAGGRAAQLAELPPPYVPGVDDAGIIEPLGPGIDDRLHVGDAVIAFVVPMCPIGGTHAEQVVVEGASVVRALLGAAMVLAFLRARATRSRHSIHD
jgi:NADPH:quinone reductase